MQWWLLGLGAVSAVLGLNVLRPLRWPSAAGLLSFWLGWTVGDLPAYAILIQGVLAAWLIAQGALVGWPGWLGLILLVAGLAALLRGHAVAHSAQDIMDRGLGEVGVPEDRDRWKSRRLFWPFLGVAPGVRQVHREVVARVGSWTQRADVFFPESEGEGRPVLVFVHGGGWVSSFREFQGLPLMIRLVRRGWTCIRISYRLSPRATFPDHLRDVKRGLAWARQNAHRWGGDPERFFALHGNSAGAHLAALAALTPNDPAYQEEDADTSVDVCVPIYGPMDLSNRHGRWGPDFRWFMRWFVIKQPFGHRAWAEASPIARIGPNAPPFFVVHGTADSLVPVQESRDFVQAMRESGHSCDFVEIPGGQHALDVFQSRKGVVAASGITRWLQHRLQLADAEDG